MGDEKCKQYCDDNLQDLSQFECVLEYYKREEDKQKSQPLTATFSLQSEGYLRHRYIKKRKKRVVKMVSVGSGAGPLTWSSGIKIKLGLWLWIGATTIVHLKPKGEQ